jgi:hypothetical protein
MYWNEKHFAYNVIIISINCYNYLLVYIVSSTYPDHFRNPPIVPKVSYFISFKLSSSLCPRSLLASRPNNLWPSKGLSPPNTPECIIWTAQMEKASPLAPGVWYSAASLAWPELFRTCHLFDFIQQQPYNTRVCRRDWWPNFLFLRLAGLLRRQWFTLFLPPE